MAIQPPPPPGGGGAPGDRNGPFLANTPKPALLKNPERADVVLSHVGVEGPRADLLEEQPQRFGRHTFPPEFPPNPIADLSQAALLPAVDGPRDLAAGEDRPAGHRLGGEDLPPVRTKRLLVSRGEGSHLRRDGVLLVGKEGGEVAFAHFSEGDAARQSNTTPTQGGEGSRPEGRAESGQHPPC